MAYPGGVRRRLAQTVTRVADGLVRLLGVSPAAGRERISWDVLRDLVAANTVLRGEERALIAAVLTAGGRQVREVIVPRTEVMFLDARLTASRALRAVRSQMHARFPVVDGSPDEVVGLVHLRDLVGSQNGDRTRTVGQLAAEIKRLPSSKPLLGALAEMRREGHRMAVVVDEYGGTAGIVTLEGLISELIAELPALVEPGGPAVPVDLDGLLNLAGCAERTGLELPEGPYETVGGYVMAALGRLPRVGDEVTVSGWTLRVTALDGRRVARVRLDPPDSPAVVVPGQASRPAAELQLVHPAAD